MNKAKKAQINKIRRAKRTRAKIKSVSDAPRLSVFRSNKDMYFQIIDDSIGKTLVSVHTKEIKNSKVNGKDKESDSGHKKNKTEIAFEAGKMIAKKAIEKKVEKVVFDKGSFRYHGRVRSAADGAREGGLKF